LEGEKRDNKNKYVERDDRDQDTEMVQGRKRVNNFLRRRGRRKAINDTPTDLAKILRIAKKDVRDAKIQAGVTTAIVLAAAIAVTEATHGLGAPVLALVAVAWDKGDREIRAAKEDLRMLMAKEAEESH
jgi:hypothetical protein